jgi:hypothetical protein
MLTGVSVMAIPVQVRVSLRACVLEVNEDLRACIFGSMHKG